MSLWEKVESAPASAALFSWKLRFGKSLPVLLPWFLGKTNGRAESVPCPSNCGCFHRVTEENLAVCNCGECEDIVLAPGDSQILKPNWEALGSRLRDAYGLERKNAGFAVPMVWQVGDYHKGALHVMLVVQPERVAFNEAIAQLVARVEGQFVVFTPTGKHADVLSGELLSRVNARLFNLEAETILMKDGRISAKTSAKDLFGPLLPQKAEEITDDLLRQGYAQLVMAAKSTVRSRKGDLKLVFDLYCLQELSVREVRIKAKCSHGTVMNRLAEIHSITGLKAEVFRNHRAFIAQMEKELSDPRAARLRRKDAAYGDAPGGDNDTY